jgi:hypothetical protein
MRHNHAREPAAAPQRPGVNYAVTATLFDADAEEHHGTVKFGPYTTRHAARAAFPAVYDWARAKGYNRSAGEITLAVTRATARELERGSLLTPDTRDRSGRYANPDIRLADTARRRRRATSTP